MPIRLEDQKTLSEQIWFMWCPVQFLLDIGVLSIAFFLAYLPAINVQLGNFYLDVAIRQLPFVVLVQFSALFLVGTYSILWRDVSIEDLKVFLLAAFFSARSF